MEEIYFLIDMEYMEFYLTKIILNMEALNDYTVFKWMETRCKRKLPKRWTKS